MDRALDENKGASSTVTEEVFVQATKSQNTTNKVARQQVFLTLCGAALIVVSFIIVFTTFAVTLVSTKDALDEAGLDIRKRVTGSVLEEVALTLKPVYTSTRRLAEQASVGTVMQDPIWPPTPETFANNYTDLVATLWIQLQHDLHLRHVEADGSGKEYIPFLDLSAQLALQEDWQTPATNMDECKHLLRVALNAGSAGEDLGSELEKTVLRTVILTDAEGNATGLKYQQQFNTESYTVNSEIDAELPETPCEQGMTPLWGGHPVQDAFANFSWYGPASTEGRFIYGSAPFYSMDGSMTQTGVFSSAISVHKSVNPALHRILKDGEQFTKGAHLILLSQSGVILGESEFADQNDPNADLKYTSASSIPSGSHLSKAIRGVRYEAGHFCPEEKVFFHDDHDRLINAVPFFAEDYGMPPLTERWCVIATVPRRNIYDAIDSAQFTTIATGCINFVLFLCAIVLLIASLYLALKSSRRLREEKLRADLRQVLSGVKEVHSLNSPLVLISGRAFLQLQRLEHYESLRDRKCILVLDSLESVGRFKENNMVLFFSHQWHSFSNPDADGGKLVAMQQAVLNVLDNPDTDKEVYIWCDYCCIAQRHNKMQQAAITSLPTFASLADKFIVMVPPTVHADLGTLCNWETYGQRGWCRAEMLARACSGGVEDVYICQDKIGTLVPMKEEELTQMNLNVFDGQYTVPEDVEDLVKPVLGLYSLVLRQRDLPHMQAIYTQMEKQKDSFFPEKYNNKKTGEEVELFGRCIRLLERYFAEGDDMNSRQISMTSRPTDSPPKENEDDDDEMEYENDGVNIKTENGEYNVDMVEM